MTKNTNHITRSNQLYYVYKKCINVHRANTCKETKQRHNMIVCGPMIVWLCVLCTFIGVGAKSNLGGSTFLPEKYGWKIYKMLEFYMILARKIIEIPEFLLSFNLPEKLTKFPNFTRFSPEKCPNFFYIIMARKIFFPFFAGGGGTVA